MIMLVHLLSSIPMIPVFSFSPYSSLFYDVLFYSIVFYSNPFYSYINPISISRSIGRWMMHRNIKIWCPKTEDEVDPLGPYILHRNHRNWPFTSPRGEFGFAHHFAGSQTGDFHAKIELIIIWQTETSHVQVQFLKPWVDHHFLLKKSGHLGVLPYIFGQPPSYSEFC